MLAKKGQTTFLRFTFVTFKVGTTLTQHFLQLLALGFF